MTEIHAFDPDGTPSPGAETGVSAIMSTVLDPRVAELVSTAGDTREALDTRYGAHVSVKAFGAKGDGTTDDAAAVQAALAAGAGGTVFFPPGSYRLMSALAVPAGTRVSGAGASSVLLDWSQRGAFQAASLMVWERGKVTNPSPLAASPAVGDVTVTVSEGHVFAAGDLVRITSDQQVLLGEAVKAEFQRVLSVSGNVLRLSAAVFDTYSVEQNARVERAELTTGGLSGVSIRGRGINSSGYGDTAVEFSFCRDVTVTDVRFRDVENKCLLFNSVVGADVDSCYFTFHTSFTPLQYGLALTGACQMVSMRGCSSWNDRHMITTSTSQSMLESVTYNRGIPRIITVTGCTANGSWQAPIDTHRGGEYITVVGNSLTSESTGVKIRGAHAVISGNTLIGKLTSVGGSPFGVRIGMVADDVRVVGNLIRGYDTGVRIETPDNLTRALVISDNTIDGCKWGIYLGAATATLNKVQISGNYISVGAGGFGVYANATINDLDVNGNVFEGGTQGFYMASATLSINRISVIGNTMREQTSHGMYLRNVNDAFIASNYSANREIRVADTSARVVAAANGCTVVDLTTGKIVVMK